MFVLKEIWGEPMKVPALMEVPTTAKATNQVGILLPPRK
jgi:hypothetical protein